MSAWHLYRNQYTEYHSRFTNCTRHVNTKEGFQPEDPCLCARGLLLLCSCCLYSFAWTSEGQTDSRGLWRGPVSVYILKFRDGQKKGLPIACWKDWRLAVSSGGTAANSLPGGAPGGVLLLNEVLGARRARQ